LSASSQSSPVFFGPKYCGKHDRTGRVRLASQNI
jgi:hypothetical protein